MTAKRYHLAKTDPETYSAEQLAADRETVWDGVRNPQAVRAILDMRKGDGVFIYHSMSNAAVVALAEVIADGRADPTNPKLAVAEFAFRSLIDPPVSLKEIKDSGEFADWALVRQSRLSTMPVPPEFVRWIRARRPKLKL